MSEQRLANLVRVLGVLLLLTGVVAGLEAISIRHMRSELQQLRDERTAAQAGTFNAWTSQTRVEFVETARAVDHFYREPTEGFGRADGLCPQGRPDFEPIATWVLGAYTSERLKGATPYAARQAMELAIRASDEYKARRPKGE